MLNFERCFVDSCSCHMTVCVKVATFVIISVARVFVRMECTDFEMAVACTGVRFFLDSKPANSE